MWYTKARRNTTERQSNIRVYISLCFQPFIHRMCNFRQRLKLILLRVPWILQWYELSLYLTAATRNQCKLNSDTETWWWWLYSALICPKILMNTIVLLYKEWTIAISDGWPPFTFYASLWINTFKFLSFLDYIKIHTAHTKSQEIDMSHISTIKTVEKEQFLILFYCC